jgi:hypothetical protein
MEDRKMTVNSLHAIDPSKLEAIKAEMVKLGVPSIRAIWDGEIYWAIEGTHRLAAAEALGIIPEIIEVDASDDLPADLIEETSCETGADLIDTFIRFGWMGDRYEFAE